MGGLVSTGGLAPGDGAQNGRPGTSALSEAGAGKPGARCGGHGPLPERLGDSRLDRTSIGPTTPWVGSTAY